jgi:hypothetical protein
MDNIHTIYIRSMIGDNNVLMKNKIKELIRDLKNKKIKEEKP